MLLVVRAATAEYEAAPLDTHREAYFAGFLHCWGLALELSKHTPDKDKLICAMRDYGFPEALVIALVNHLEDDSGPRREPEGATGAGKPDQ